MNAPLRRALPVIGPDAERVEPRVRGEGALRRVEALLQHVDRAMTAAFGADSNPLAETGAIANTTFLVAVVTGVLLLFWYSPSVHQAYASVAGLSRLGVLVRSIHRYGSDACMLFVLVHALKLLCARRFGGARWLAWVTGAFSLGALWLVGWLGYWLVWDERARQIALGSARLLDALPIFSDPLARSFVADDTVNSLLFFVVFFLHMLIPLAMGIALWLHITRLSRPRFLTRRRMTAWVVGSLVILSLAVPADLAPPARMAVAPAGFGIDAWYLLPMALTDRLSGGVLWTIVLVSGAALFSLPWLLVGARARVAVVNEPRCTACERCFRDCPYDAIQMVPRPSGQPAPRVARVDASKCLGCGICAGSCDSAGIGLPWFDAVEQRQELDRSIALAPPGALLGVLCAQAAGADFEIDPAGACRELPGYVVVRAPCAGWLHPLTVERALRRGVAGVLVVSCGPGSCTYREGATWTVERMLGQRQPSLRSGKVDPDRVRVVERFGVERAALVADAAAFRASRAPARARRASRIARFATAGAAMAGLCAITVGATRVGYGAPRADHSELVLSFRGAAQTSEQCRAPSPAEIARLPVHMRPKKICQRRRPDLRVRVSVDGTNVFARTVPPAGVWRDEPSVGVDRVAVPAGEHDVVVEIGDTADPNAYGRRTARRVRFEIGKSVAVVFEGDAFAWH